MTATNTNVASADEHGFAMIYDELRRIAAMHMRRERPDHTLQPTALVNEAWLRLLRARPVSLSDRGQLLSLAAGAMRRILVDYARSYRAGKRFGGKQRIDLQETLTWAEKRSDQLMALDEALEELARLDRRQYQIVELIFFGGMTGEEVGQALGISPRTVKREWSVARAWLSLRMNQTY